MGRESVQLRSENPVRAPCMIVSGLYSRCGNVPCRRTFSALLLSPSQRARGSSFPRSFRSISTLLIHIFLDFRPKQVTVHVWIRRRRIPPWILHLKRELPDGSCNGNERTYYTNQNPQRLLSQCVIVECEDSSKHQAKSSLRIAALSLV